MSKYSKEIRIRRGTIILLILIFIIIICSIISYFVGITTFWGALIGSIAAGLVVAVVQLLVDWQDQKELDKLKDLYLKKIMYNRDLRDEYSKIIRSSRSRIDLMGVTASRFFSHFADLSNEARDDAKVLLKALERGVSVRILLPSTNMIESSKWTSYDKVGTHINEIKRENPNYSLEVRYFNHIPAHSIFIVDDECIIGPIFPNVESKHTPALHLKNKSRYAELYLKYFENEWKNAE